MSRTDRQTDRRTDGRTERQTDRQTDGQRQTDGWTDGRTEGRAHKTVTHGYFFSHKCGCRFTVWLSSFVWLRPYVRTHKRGLVATFVHKFGCLFVCVAIGFVWLHINEITSKWPPVPKLATEVVFCKNEQSIHGHLDTNDHNLWFFVSVHA